MWKETAAPRKSERSSPCRLGSGTVLVCEVVTKPSRRMRVRFTSSPPIVGRMRQRYSESEPAAGRKDTSKPTRSAARREVVRTLFTLPIMPLKSDPGRQTDASLEIKRLIRNRMAECSRIIAVFGIGDGLGFLPRKCLITLVSLPPAFPWAITHQAQPLFRVAIAIAGEGRLPDGNADRSWCLAIPKEMQWTGPGRIWSRLVNYGSQEFESQEFEHGPQQPAIAAIPAAHRA